jgi:hypothetical protein
MCGRSFTEQAAVRTAPRENAFVATRGSSDEGSVQRPQAEATVDNASLAILAIALILIGCGISLEAPGLAILYTVIMLPALLAVYVKRQRRLASDRPPGWGDTIVDFFSGVALAIGILVALPVVAIIALMIYCAVISATHGSF